MPLKKEDEELRMLREWVRRLAEATGGKRRTSGLIVQSLVREHLLENNFNVSRNNVRINSFDGKHQVPVHLLVLNNGVPRNEKQYSPDEIRFVIEIRSNAVKIAEKIRKKFDEIETKSRLDRFVVVVLSETKEHMHEITREKIGDKNRDVFTLFGRKNYPRSEFSEEIIDEMLASGEMWKTGQWEGFLDHLKK